MAIIAMGSVLERFGRERERGTGQVSGRYRGGWETRCGWSLGGTFLSGEERSLRRQLTRRAYLRIWTASRTEV